MDYFFLIPLHIWDQGYLKKIAVYYFLLIPLVSLHSRYLKKIAEKDGVGGSSRLGFRLEGRCRGVVRLSIPPKAAYFEGRCRGVVPFRV